MMVVFLFLRRTAATIAAGITVRFHWPATCAAMWLAGFSIDNLSLNGAGRLHRLSWSTTPSS